MSAGKIFYYLNAALITGIALGSFLYTEKALLFLLIPVIGLVVFYVHRSVTLSTGVILICALGALLVVFQLTNIQKKHDALSADTPLEFTGAITNIQKKDNRNILDVKLDSVSVRLSTYSYEFNEGDIVRVSCTEIKEDYFLPLAVSRGVVAECYSAQVKLVQTSGKENVLQTVRASLLQRVNRIFPSPEAELLQGLLLGKQANLPADLQIDLQRTGTTHIVVLSGFNITIIAFVINKLIRRFRIGIQLASLLSIFAIWTFVLLAGFSPPTVRAAIMVSLVLIAHARGKAYGGVYALIFSASILLLIDPLLLRWSLSFELSFLATIGVLFKDKFVPTLHILPNFFSLRENVRTTIGATLVTLPLLIITFGSVSFVAIFTNAFILSLVPITMALGAIVLGISFASFQVALVCGVFSYTLLRIITYIIELFSQISFAYTHVSEFFAGAVIVIVFTLFILKRKIKINREDNFDGARGKAIGIASSIALVTLGILLACHSQNAVTFFDVGQGDATHIRSSGGYDMLIDTGPDETVVSRLGRTMPYFDRTIELLVITHPHADHLSGFFSVIQKYDVKEIGMTGTTYESPIYRNFLEEIQKRNLTTKIITNQEVEKIGDMSIHILWPPENYSSNNLNNTSIVLQIEQDGKKFLFMGDAEMEVENELVSQYGVSLQSQVLKIGHHGSNNASTEEFLVKVRPMISVISVGADNQFGHPNEQALNRIKSHAKYLLRTDTCGNISVITGGVWSLTSGC